MKIKKGFILRDLLDEHMVVAVGEAGAHFHGVIRLNDSAAWCWQELEKGITKEALIEKMCERYDNLTREQAEKDVEELLQVIDAAVEQ